MLAESSGFAYVKAMTSPTLTSIATALRTKIKRVLRFSDEQHRRKGRMLPQGRQFCSKVLCRRQDKIRTTKTAQPLGVQKWLPPSRTSGARGTFFFIALTFEKHCKA
jgi:hypothetical protein